VIEEPQNANPIIVVTGATGNLGRQLVPLLEERGATVTVAGRDLGKLQACFPSTNACTYDEIASKPEKADLLVHLAVLNNNVDASLDEFERVNVDLTILIAEAARTAGIRRMVNVSSTHALDDSNHSYYARSKRLAVARLKEQSGISITNLYLPAVVGTILSGRLSTLSRLPNPLRQQLLTMLSALKPTVRPITIANHLIDMTQSGQSDDRILSEGQENNTYYQFGKRAIDLSFALGVVLLFWWLFIVLGIAIRLQSKGPAIFAQERVGRGGKTFICYKFRTMHMGTPNVGTHETPQNAVTPIGTFLRSTKLDELPQLVNILRNEVSLIGPRPCLPSQRELIEARSRRGVLMVKPGISGYAQINGIDMSEPERLSQWDERYVKMQGLILDVKIVIATALGRGSGDRVKKR
jgi:lipopolysaccharide/colanic/teichoic acid biosynthesis glycosyltransferase